MSPIQRRREKRDAEIIRMRMERTSLQEIAQRFQISQPSVSRICREAGLEDIWVPKSRKREIPSAYLVFSGELLRSLRTRRRLTQRGLAAMIGVKNLDSIRRWEKGEVEPSGTIVLRLLSALDASPEELTAESNRA
jgi:DNA-binding transcriptional regulator YiaG